MPNSYFEFKQFIVHQDKCAMKVGTDGVLLGAWTEAENINSALDIGTGTGLIALMLAQNSEADITAIEIDENAYEQATLNVKNSKWSNRIDVQHISLQDFAQKKQTFDLVVSNPPYFHNAYKSEKVKRTIARHTDKLTYSELIVYSRILMNQKSFFCVILPYDNHDMFVDEAKMNGLFLHKQTDVIPVTDKPAKRVLLMFAPEKNNSFEHNTLIIEKNGRHRYSDEYIELTKNYYLKMH